MAYGTDCGLSMQALLFLLVILSVLDSTRCTISNDYFTYPLYRLHYGGNLASFNSSRFAYISIWDDSKMAFTPNLTRDTIVILADHVPSHALPYENHLRYLQGKEHVKGMIFFPYSGIPGQIIFMNDGTQSLDVWMSAFEMNDGDLWEVIRFYKNESNADVGVLVEGVETEWYVSLSSYSVLVVQIIMIAQSCICIVYYAFLLVPKLRAFSTINLSLMCLSMDFGSSILKLLWKCSAWGRLRLYVWWFQAVLYSWWIPFQITTIVIVLFYWNKRLKKSNCAILSIEKKYKNVISFSLCLLFLMELISSLTRVFLDNSVFYYGIQGLYALSLVLIVSYVIVTKYGIRRYQIKESKTITFNKTLRKTNSILNCACALIIATLGFQLLRITARSSAMVSIISWSGIFMCSDIVSLLLGFIFHPKDKSSKSGEMSKRSPSKVFGREEEMKEKVSD